MSIDLKTIKHISKLSRISVDDQRAKKLVGDLNSILKNKDSITAKYLSGKKKIKI